MGSLQCTMATLRPPTGLALLVCLLFFTPTALTQGEKCRTGCHGSKSELFKYAEGTSYKYNVESELDIGLSSAEGQQTATKLKATVVLTQQGQCNQVIKLQNVQIFGSDGKKRTGIPNLDKPIKINFHDGHIEDMVCADPTDTQVSLNIKRAVASLFQAATKRHVETDVFGVCPTDISTSKEGNQVTIIKSRTLNRCSHRENVKYDFMATAFNLNSEIKSSPLLRGDYQSEMRIKDGILDHVLVTEDYLYMPFSVGKNGIKSSVQTKLQFAGKTKSDANADKVNTPKSIIFENPHPTVAEKSDVQTILGAIKDTANGIGATVTDKSASKFSNLMRIMSQAKKSDLLAAFNQVQSGAGFNDKNKAKNVFLDALFKAGTGDCLEVAVELLKNHQLNPLEEKLVYLGMSFNRHPTASSIATVATLLDNPKVPREAYLGIGTLVSHHCHSHNCKNLEQLKALNAKLLAKLKDGKPANRDAENDAITVLKTLRNMRHLADSVIPKVVAIAQDKKASNRLRVAALEAYLADACKDKIRDSAIGILKDTQQDAEIRIKAYQVIAECPNGKAANALKTVLDSEPSYQVGGYIVSHLRNLRASVNPDKELAKKELSNIQITKQYPLDPRKYSFNQEFSYAIDTLGTSSSIEANTIYSQSSFLPRSTSLNLTTEMFGHKFNFMEIDLRQENLDRVLEHYLGPLGLLRTNTPDELLKKVQENDGVHKTLENRLKKLRARRQAPKAEIESIGKTVQIKTNELNNDLDLDMSLKLFGSEFLFLTFNENSEIYTPEKIIDKVFDQIEKAIKKAEDFDHTITKHGVFIDLELAYPTSMGFPLKLSVEGTHSVQLVTAGSINVKALMNGKDNVLKLKLIPSANIELAGRMTVDASLMEQGLKVASTLHTATGGDLNIKLTEDSFDVQVSLPIEKQEIISADHEINFISFDSGMGETKTPIKFAQPEHKDFSVCVDHLSPIIGLTACADLNSPSNQQQILPFPLNGNSKFAVYIQKDAPLVYHFQAKKTNTETNKGIDLILETLEGQNKKVSFTTQVYANPAFVTVTLDSPIKKLVADARITDDGKEKSISAKLQHDTEEYMAKIGISISGNDAKSTYTPLIEFKVPGTSPVTPPYSVEGSVTAERSPTGTKYTLNDVKLIAPNVAPITFRGNLGVENQAYFADIKVDDGTKNGNFKGRFEVKNDLLKIDAEVVQNLSPMSNFRINYQLKKGEFSLSNDLLVSHGPDLNNKERTLKLKNEITNKFFDRDDYLYSTKNVFSYPLVGVEGKVDATKAPKSVAFDVQGKYNKLKLGAKLNAKYNQKQPGDYDINAEFNGMDNKVHAVAKRDITGDTSKIDNLLEINGKKAEVKGTVTHKVKPQDVQIGCDLNVVLPQLSEPLTIKHNYVHKNADCAVVTKVSTPSQNYVDVDLKAHTVNGANGHAKVNVPNVLIVDGEIKADKWTGKAHLLVHAPKADHKVKLDSTFSVANPKYDVQLVLYPNFEMDDRKISLGSQNVIEVGKIDTKNVLDIFGSKFEANANAAGEGDLENGKVNGEVDVTLPSGMYLTAKINRAMTSAADGTVNGNAFVNVEHRVNKNTPGRKLTVKADIKDVNFENMKGLVTYGLTADDSNGKNVNADVTIKMEGDDLFDLQGKVYGSILKAPVEFNLKAVEDDLSGDYTLGTKAQGFQLDANAKYDLANTEKRPFLIKGSAHVQTDNPKLKTIKADGLASLYTNGDKIEGKLSNALFVDDDGTNPDSTVDFKQEVEVLASPHHGSIKGSLNLQKLDPITYAVGFAHTEDNGIVKCQGDASLKYAKDKTIKVDVTMIKPNKLESKLDLKVETPFENAKLSEIHMSTKRSEDFKHLMSEGTATIDGKKWSSSSEIKVSETSPVFMTQMTHPDGHTDKILGKSEKTSSSFKGQLELVSRKFAFDGSVDANLVSVEEFSLVVKGDSPQLKLDKIVIEAKSQKNKGAKVVDINATSNGNNLIKGSASYKAKDEAGKFIVEGSGEFTVKDEKKNGNFKFIKRALTIDKDQEQGLEITFDAGLGNKAVDAEFKLSNKQFRILNSYCEEKKQCAHFEIDSKLNAVDITEYENELEITMDLRKLGLEHEFGLKSVTKRKQLTLDHTVDVHFQTQENNKYQYSLYLHPKEAGVSLTTPKRQISLEGRTDVPPKFKGPMKYELALYLNKKAEPTKKTAISGTAEYTGNEKNGKYKSEARLTSPGLSKDFVISHESTYDVAAKQVESTTTLDIFGKANNKIVIASKQHLTQNPEAGQYGFEIHSTIKSQPLGIDIAYDEVTYNYDSKLHTFKSSAKLTCSVSGSKHISEALFEVSPSKVHSLLKLLDKNIWNVEHKLQLSKEAQTVDSDIDILGVRPLTSHLEVRNFNTLKYQLGPKGQAKKLTVNAGLIPGQIADFRVDVNSKEVMKASVQLDEKNFLKPDYHLSTENLKKLLLEPAQNEFTAAIKEGKKTLKELGDEATKDVKTLAETTKKNIPNLKGAKDYYAGELKKVTDEITADKTFQELHELFQKIFGTFARSVSEILSKTMEVLEQVVNTAKANIDRFSEAFEKEIIPRLTELVDQLWSVSSQVFNRLADMVFLIIGKISEVIDAHQAELKQLATTFSNISQDLGRFLHKNYERVRLIISDTVNTIFEELKALPITEAVQEFWTSFKHDVYGMSEPFQSIVKDMLTTIKEMVPTAEAKEAVQAIMDYFDKKVRNEPVDDLVAIENIVRMVVNAFRKALSGYRLKDMPVIDATGFSMNYVLPRIVAAKFSPLNFLLMEDGPWDAAEKTLLSWSFNPRHLIGPPFRMYAFVVQGQHIFTFDGKHLTFPGSCNYLLARDARDGNFTIAGTYKDSILTALTFADKTESVTLKKGGQLMHNKDAAEYPVRNNKLAAYRLYNSVNVYSSAGVEIKCDANLDVCKFSISGFYHGRLRGLLGNPNNEPYDDFTQANGKIVASESDFGNSYKMGSSCKPVKTVDHHADHKRDAKCTEIFTEDAGLFFCQPFVDIDLYRLACDHGVAAGVKGTVEAVSKAYVEACHAKYVLASTPDEFLTCTNAAKEYKLYDTWTEKLPGKVADIVIVIDQIKTNEPVYKELLQPALAELIKELGAKGVNDVDVHVVGYGGDWQDYPLHFTSGGKMTFKGKLPSMKFAEPKSEKLLLTGHEQVDNVLAFTKEVKETIDLVLGKDLQARSFSEAYSYPFRSHAIKTLIAVTGNPCKQGKLLLLQILRTLFFEEKNIRINLITPFRELKSTDAKASKSIIGFNEDEVFTADGKKSSVGVDDLDYDDFCVDFTVEDGGNVYVTDNFLQAKGAARKQFAQTLAHTLADQMLNTEQVLECECEMNMDFLTASAKCESEGFVKKNK